MKKYVILEKLKMIRSTLQQNKEDPIVVRQYAKMLITILDDDEENIIKSAENIIHGVDELLELQPKNKIQIEKKVKEFIKKDLNSVIFSTENQ